MRNLLEHPITFDEMYAALGEVAEAWKSLDETWGPTIGNTTLAAINEIGQRLELAEAIERIPEKWTWHFIKPDDYNRGQVPDGFKPNGRPKYRKALYTVYMANDSIIFTTDFVSATIDGDDLAEVINAARREVEWKMEQRLKQKVDLKKKK